MAIELRGSEQRLYLRATLPPKPNSGKIKAYQQRICLHMPGTWQCLRQAEEKAKLLGAELNLGRFDWANWEIASDRSASAGTIAHAIDRFEQDYWQRTERSPTSLSTWKNSYLRVFSRLDGDAELSIETLRDRILETPANSHDRQRTTQVLRRLAKFASLQGWETLRNLEGNYSPRRVNPRTLPTDAQIAAAWQSAANRSHGWGWVFGVMAAYGLRNHEVFWLDFDRFPAVTVGDRTKSKRDRIVRPLYPEWAELWSLGDRILPNLKLPTDLTSISNEKLGGKITAWFCLHSDFAAYNLRHCYARRCFEFDIPIATAARSMGHSRQIHEETYQAWIDEAAYQASYERAIDRVDRPQPPTI